MTLNATQSQQATAPQSGGHTIGSGMQASVPFGFLAMVLTCTVTDSEVCCEEPALADKTLRHKDFCTMNAICMRTSHEVRRKTHTCVRCSFRCSASYQRRCSTCALFVDHDNIVLKRPDNLHTVTAMLMPHVRAPAFGVQRSKVAALLEHGVHGL